jgi:class 3 adenylate cyclase
MSGVRAGRGSEQVGDPSRQLRLRYVVTLSIVAVFVVSGALSIFLLVGLLKTDPPVINAAGRQRMLSQRLTKEALRLRHATIPESTATHLGYLRETMEDWARGHERLRSEVDGPAALFSDASLRAALDRVDPLYRTLREAGNELLSSYEPATGGVLDSRAVQSAVDRILEQESAYLSEMDRMVSLYEEKASSRVTLLRRAAMVFALSSLVVLAATALFVFEPAARFIRSSFLDAEHLLENSHDSERQLETRNRFIQEIFGRYVGGRVVERLLNRPEALELGGEERTVTLLMSDLRGFSALASSLHPQKTMQLLNHYLDCMTQVIENYDGTVEDFMGDSVFAVFGAPYTAEDDSLRAVACALSMQLELKNVNEAFLREGLPSLGVGIGVHTGSVIAGNVGSVKRAKYGVVGPAVNLASRLEECALAGQVLVSEATLGELSKEAVAGNVLTLQVKGFEETIRAYEILGLKGRLQIDRVLNGESLIEIREPFPICYRRMAGDRVGNVTLRGQITRLSPHEIEVEAMFVDNCPGRSDASGGSLRCPVLPALSAQDDVEISLSPTADRILSTAVYARVTDVVGNGGSLFQVHLTSVSPSARAIIDGLVKSSQQT